MKQWQCSFFFHLLLLLAWGHAQPPQHIAIIGAGIGGSASAYYLRQLLGEAVTITVFESSDVRVGGRVEHVLFTNTTSGATVPLEIGASILYSGNKHLMDVIAALGLHAGPPVFSGGTTGIYDGHRLVFHSSPWNLVTALRVFWRYGFWSMLKLRRLVRATLDKFEKIYDLQDTQQQVYDTPAALWEALGLGDLTKVSIREYLHTQGVGAPDSHIVGEFVGSINRVNYNTDNGRLNALAGLVSLCPTVTGEVISVKEGNSQMALAMLQAAHANLRFNVTVGTVQVLKKGGNDKKESYRLLQEDGSPVAEEGFDAAGVLQAFDAVVVATPFAFSQLAVVVDDDTSISALPPTEFVTTHATFVQGIVRPGYFGTAYSTPAAVYMAENASVAISSLSLHITLNDTHEHTTGIYKMFSSMPLQDAFLDNLFLPGWELLHHREWLAYPLYHPPEDATATLTPFVLRPALRVYYVNALESSVSAMEILAIGAKNVALLVARSFGSDHDGGGGSGGEATGWSEEKSEL